MARRRGAPRVCGDDPAVDLLNPYFAAVLPAYVGMIPAVRSRSLSAGRCSPRMRGWSLVQVEVAAVAGSVPRVCGDDPIPYCGGGLGGVVFPADAGMILRPRQMDHGGRPVPFVPMTVAKRDDVRLARSFVCEARVLVRSSGWERREARRDLLRLFRRDDTPIVARE